MGTAISLELSLVMVAVFLLLCVFASKASAKLGIPALILFLGIGMLAGSDGPGGIHFSDVGLTKGLGTVALAFILFAGGLESGWQTLRPVLFRGLALSTIGVVVTASAIGAVAYYLLGLKLLPALLLGAVVSSTDAAAVFGVLRSSGIGLKHKLNPLLEFESGTNDPLAAFLTIGLTSLIVNPVTSVWSLIPALLLEMPLGVAVGIASSAAAVWIINRLRLEYDGLYPVVTIATVCFSFGGASLIHGNPFLAVYVAGVAMGSRNFLHRIALIQFHDALAWLFQIVMFVVLGLLVFPRQLLEIALPGLLLALFLIFVARPAAVFISLAFARMSIRSKLFVSWAGLRGAVPIILATFPLMANVPDAPKIFNLVFFIVLTSVLIQGTTMRRVAQKLKVIVERAPALPDLKPAGHEELLQVELQANSPAAGKQVVDLNLPTTALLVLLTRHGASYIPRGSTVLQPGDIVLVATRREDQDDLRARFERT
jgi:cell volume regulation protein A